MAILISRPRLLKIFYMQQAEIFKIFHNKEKGISNMAKILLLLAGRTMDWRGDDVNDRRYPEAGQAKGEG